MVTAVSDEAQARSNISTSATARVMDMITHIHNIYVYIYRVRKLFPQYTGFGSSFHNIQASEDLSTI